ncbi:MAG: hypothetical protein ABIO77_02765 [Ginsengibacter sp.]
MQKSLFLIFFVLCFQAQITQAQTYSLVIRNGHVIDPKNNIHEVMDVDINEGKIVLIAKNIDSRQPTQVVDVQGMYVK